MNVFMLIFLSSFFVHSLWCQDFTSLEQIYDFWAPHYNTLVEKTEYNVLKWIEKHKDLFSKAEMLVLDLGCADGIIGDRIHFYNPHARLVGVDFSKNMVACCREKSFYQSVLCADLSYGLPASICNTTYDIIIATGCLEFVSNHEQLCKQIESVLKPGGYFLLTVQVATGTEKLTALDRPLTVYTREQIEALLYACALKVVSLEFNEAAYKNSKTQEPTAYFMIIAHNTR